MMTKRLDVFYGIDTLPYKDKARTVHFPIVGSSFVGASNTTEIRFYFEQIGDENATYIASAKLPNGKQGYKLLSKLYDSEIGEWYAKLDLSAFFTQVKGDLYISLRGYQGGAEIIYDSESDIYRVEGDPIIQGTGSIKLAIAYAVPYQQGDAEEEISFEDIFQELGKKLDIVSDDYIKVVPDISNFANIEDYPLGTIIFDNATKKYYKRTATSPFYELYPFSNFYVEIDSTTTIRDLTSKGHYLVVRYEGLGGVQTRNEYIFYGNRWATDWYAFSFISLKDGRKRWATNFNGSAQEVGDDTTVASIIADSSQYRMDLQVDNLVEISSGGQSRVYYDQKLIEQIAKPNCIIKFDNEYYYPYYNNGTTITFVKIRANATTSTNVYGKIQKGIVVQYLELTNTGTNPYADRNAWYFDEYYNTTEMNKSFGTTFDFSIDNDYKITLRLFALNGTVLQSQTIDLPLESVVVDGYYDDSTESLVLVLDNGNTVAIPVHDLIEGLVNETQLERILLDYVEKSQKIAGIDLQDDISKDELNSALSNYVAISVLGSALSPEDYDKATKENAVLVYQNNYFYRDNVNGNIITFVSPKSVKSVNGDYSTITKQALAFNTTTGVVGGGVVSYNIYDKSQADTKLATKQNVLTFDTTPTEGSSNPVTSGGIKTAIDNAISAVYRYKGTRTVAQLNALTGQVVGDVYNVSDAGTLTDGNVQVIAGDNVAWTENGWDKLANDIDWSTYNDTFLAAGFIQAGEFDTVPENLEFDSDGNIINENWTGELTLDYMSPPIISLNISEVPETLTFDLSQDFYHMITNADWTGIMSIEYQGDKLCRKKT